MDSRLEQKLHINRRQFFGRCATGIGTAALASLVNPNVFAAEREDPMRVRSPHFAPKAKRVIYLHQSGAPSQLDLFDYKPAMKEMFDKDLPDSIRMGQRLTGMTSGQARFPVAPTIFKFQQYGQGGAWISELLPHIANIADDICIVKTIHTEAINHDPAMTFFQTGFQIAGRPSMGAWVSYGLGSLNRDLPTFVALSSRGSGRPSCQPLYDRLWGSGFLPSVYQGVKFRGTGDPVLYLSDPAGVDKTIRRKMLDDVAALNQDAFTEYQDPEIVTRIEQYELAYRMQTSVPELTDLSDEPESTFELYGPESRTRGTYAANCLLARRLAERGVRFIQLYHMGWDQHSSLPKELPGQCRDTDQPSAALISDLKQRGLLEDTLVIWGGEFGRTIYSQGTLTETDYGRDHHPKNFAIFMAGGGIKPGMVYGETDEFSYNIVENPMSVHDLQATILNQLGLDHEMLTYMYQGRRFRLTDVSGVVVNDILA
ncbi:MAG TPA: DUF1501 domain-containing protein [Candidatus Hydrogenedentes bacterium]|nr:DUF1501 domain-containing protein [Candidatus Hydrogenedentota bacterium]